jgi:RNA polymerase I-specific transcription initiation factor RRN7
MAARRLAKLLKFEFSFPSGLAKHGVAAYPESKIISLVVIATKLSQPFDGVVRVPESITDPSSLTVNWEGWIKATAKAPAEGFQRGREIEITEKDVFKMSDKKLDSYLDWYQRTWIDDSGDLKCKLPSSTYILYHCIV